MLTTHSYSWNRWPNSTVSKFNNFLFRHCSNLFSHFDWKIVSETYVERIWNVSELDL